LRTRRQHGAPDQLKRRRRRLALAGTALLLGCSLWSWAPALLAAVLGWLQPDIAFRGPAGRRVVYVTIDDGPSEHTGDILAALRRHGVPATFFITGSHVADAEALRRIVAEGHALGNHLWTTRRASALTLEEFRADFDATQAVLRPVAPVRLFRPSSDFGTADQLRYVREQGLLPVMGTMYPLDHRLGRPALLAGLARWLRIDGGILILHDGGTRGRTTAAVLDRLIPELKEDGCEFGRLDEALTATER